jgi:hypothetical protein
VPSLAVGLALFAAFLLGLRVGIPLGARRAKGGGFRRSYKEAR